jgi:hypothetical protein
MSKEAARWPTCENGFAVWALTVESAIGFSDWIDDDEGKRAKCWSR